MRTREEQPGAREQPAPREKEHRRLRDEFARQLDAIVEALWGSELLLEWSDAQPATGTQ